MRFPRSAPTGAARVVGGAAKSWAGPSPFPRLRPSQLKRVDLDAVSSDRDLDESRLWLEMCRKLCPSFIPVYALRLRPRRLPEAALEKLPLRARGFLVILASEALLR